MLLFLYNLTKFVDLEIQKATPLSGRFGLPVLKVVRFSVLLMAMQKLCIEMRKMD